MTEISSLAPHRPDSLAGAIAAFEGIRGGCALINGPLSCRTYTAYLLEWLDPQTSLDTSYLTHFFLGRSRVPSTYVDERDYIYGSGEKVVRALQFLDSKNYKLIGVINTPGTSLTGEDLARMVETSGIRSKTAIVDSTGFVGTFADGFKTGAIETLKAVAVKGNKIPRSVNIIGLSVVQHGWESNVAEIRRVLGLMGIEVLSAICCGDGLDSISNAGRAELNLVVHEEYGDTIAGHLEKEFGTPAIGVKECAPIGLAGSEEWFGAIARHFGLSDDILRAESERVRMKCYNALEKASTFSGKPRGMTFAVFGDSSQVAPLVIFLHQYLGMYPVLVGLRETGSNSEAMMRGYFEKNSIDPLILMNPDQYAIMEGMVEREPELVLGSSIEAWISRTMEGREAAFVPIALPYNERITLTERPLLGFNGVLTLVEDVLNSFKSRMFE
jgi:nitrogenase molybdenum-iron protein alpha/beta subunit